METKRETGQLMQAAYGFLAGGGVALFAFGVYEAIQRGIDTSEPFAIISMGALAFAGGFNARAGRGRRTVWVALGVVALICGLGFIAL